MGEEEDEERRVRKTERQPTTRGAAPRRRHEPARTSAGKCCVTCGVADMYDPFLAGQRRGGVVAVVTRNSNQLRAARRCAASASASCRAAPAPRTPALALAQRSGWLVCLLAGAR